MPSFYVRLFLLCVLFLLCAHIAWADVQFEDANCKFSQAPNGTFYQAEPGMDYHNYMTPRCGSIAYSSYLGQSNWGYRIAGIKTGSIQARSNIARYGDDLSHLPCGSSGQNGCRAAFSGSGHTYGVSTSLTYTYRMFTPEAGLFFYRHAFRASAQPLEPGAGTEQTFSEQSKWTDTPALLFGLTAKYDNVYVFVRRFDTTLLGAHRAVSLTNHSFTMYGVGVQF